MVLTRTLECTMPGGAQPSVITVSLGAPEPDPLAGGDFRVLLEVSGFSDPYAQHIHGVDPIQALLAALSIVPDVVALLAGPGASVTWLGSEDLGFRYAPPAEGE